MPPTPTTPTWVAAEDTPPVAEVDALATAATLTDGTAPLSEQVLRHLRPGHLRPGHLRPGHLRPDHAHPGPEVGHLLARDRDGALVGYAQLDAAATTPDGAPDPVAELVVHPDHRRRGAGSALLAALLDRTALLARTAQLRVWAHGGHPGAAALAARFGLTGDRELWRLHRSLREPLADPVFPDGVVLRPFRPGADEPELLRVNNAAFRWHPEQGGWTLDDVAAREDEAWFDAPGVLLAVDAADPAHVVGFHWTKVHAAGPDGPAIGEVYVLAVDPAARGRRLGPALTLAGLAHLRDRGLDAVMLYVEADNAAAVRVYRGLGFTPWGVDVSYRTTPSSGVRAVDHR